MRVAGIRRGSDVTILIDGEQLDAFRGETLAAALLAAGRLTFRLDRLGKPRGLYCNMGTCCECMVGIVQHDGSVRPSRACLVDVVEGLCVRTRAAETL